MIGNEINEIYKLLSFYFKKEIVIHLSYNLDDWTNGTVVKLNKQFVVINDLKNGVLPQIYLETIKSIKVFREKE